MYNTLNDKDYTNPDDLTITTIEDAIYLGYKNDVLEYSYFIDKIYRNKKIYDTIDIAVDKAVTQCIEEGVLSDLLLAHRSEVTDMVLTEFNEEEYIEMVKKECIEIGEKRGFEIGEKRGFEIGKKEVIMEMIKDGIISPEVGAEKLGISVDELKL